MKKIIGFLLIVGLTIQCAEKQSQEKPSWHGSMQGLAQSLNELLPYLIQQSPVITSTQEKEYNRILKQLASHSTPLDSKKMILPNHDISLGFLAKEFSQELTQVKKLSGSQSPEQMRPHIRELARYCVACHTRLPARSQPHFLQPKEKMSHFHPFERATYYTAFRHYEAALLQYEQALTDRKWREQNPRLWAESVMNMLAISVRVKNNANLTLEFLSHLFDQKSLPKQIQPAARAWQRHAKEWDQETTITNDLAQAKHLIQLGVRSEKNQRHSGLLAFVRASSLLNQYMEHSERTPEKMQPFYYYSGLIAQNLRRLNFSEFPRSHFLACQQLDPKSRWGQLCEKRLR
jgi:hypothetical protein